MLRSISGFGPDTARAASLGSVEARLRTFTTDRRRQEAAETTANQTKVADKVNPTLPANIKAVLAKHSSHIADRSITYSACH